MPLSFSERLRRLQQKGQKGDRYPDIGSFKSGAHSQAQSPFFRLPREVRDVVYLELWRSKGLEQHVFSENGRYRHTPCITSYSNLGQCEVKLDQLSDQDWQLPASDPSIDMEWVNRHVSKFNGHWRCEDRYNETMAGVEPCLFMSCLLTCKTLYLECRESIYGNVDFIFTSIGEAHNFLLVRKSPIVKELEMLSFSLRLSRLHSEDSDSEPSTRRWMEDGAQWQRVRKSLADLPKLRKITIWLEVAGALRSVDTRVNLDPLTFEPEVASLVTLDTVFLKSIDWKDIFGVDYDSR